MNVLKRVVSTRRHTVGYIVSGMGRVSRTNAVQLARRSKLRGVRVMNGPNGAYLVSETGRSLYNLPVIIDREAVRTDSPRARRSNRRQTAARSR
jgi:hypothetical protein